MAQDDVYEKIEDLAAASGTYDPKAFLFVLSCVEHCRTRLQRSGHVTGKELLESARQLALEHFGPSAKLVFDSWGLRTTEDIGRIVFLMVEAEILHKTDEDKIDDFRNVYDFETEFVRDYPW